MGLSAPSLSELDDDDGDEARSGCDAGECNLARTPSSPSNSWSSGETVPLPADSPLGGDGEPRRPKRCKISREQLAVLVSSFEEEPLPNFDQRQALAKLLGMTPRSVQIWFQNRRQRLKPMQPKPCGGIGQAIGGGVCLTAPPARGAGGHVLTGSSSNAQQHLGVPGLAAAAGLCHGSTSGFESLVLGHAMTQLHGAAGLHHNSPGGVNANSGLGGSLSSYDVMEPFAATKALLGASYNAGSALSPRSQSAPAPVHGSHATLMHGCGGVALPSSALTGLAHACGSAHAELLGKASQQQPTSIAAPSTSMLCGVSVPTGQEKADGLLLLLACADDESKLPPNADNAGL